MAGVSSLQWRRACTLACSAALLAQPAPAAAIAAGAPARPAASACTTATLDVWLDTSGNGAAGSSYYDLQLTNLGRGACTLRGFPGVSAVDLRGDRVGAPAAREAGHVLRTRTLAPGATVTAVVRIVDAGNFPTASCAPVTAAGLRVYPPGQAGSRFVPFPFQTCSRAQTSTLSVAPVGAQ
jgi:hypothetical protein